MIVAIHQPSYFPWLGLLDKISKSEVFILMDEVQFSDSGFQHRNIFLEAKGRNCYLILPVSKRGYTERPFRELRLADNYWQKKHRKFFLFNYKKHPYWEEIFPRIEFIFERRYEFLIDVVWDSMKVLFNMLAIEVKVQFQSELDYNRSVKKSDLVLELVKAVGGDVYLSGEGAKGYLDVDRFSSSGVKVVFNHFVHPVYPQRNASEFIEGLSSLDLLFNCGIEGARKIFWENKGGEDEKALSGYWDPF